jgi:hypothetical protein
VRDRAVRIMADNDPYAALLISMHTYNLLTAHADRSTIAPEGLTLLDAFLDNQRKFQDEMRTAIREDRSLQTLAKQDQTITEHFRLLQACDNLSLLTCVAYSSPAHLLHPLPLNDGGKAEVKVVPLGPRHFQLTPWPFEEHELRFGFPARLVEAKLFATSESLDSAFAVAGEQTLTVTLTR